MDRYKFRGKRVDNGEWVYGYYIAGECSYIITQETFYSAVVSLPDSVGYNHMSTFCQQVHRDTVGQYAGLKDKNDVEIYFGCQAKHVDGMGFRIGTVIFDEKMCCMGIKFEETTVFGGAVLFEQCEVIHDKENQ